MPRQVSPEFTAAEEATKKFTEKPSQDDLLKLYALYKQAKQDPAFADAPTPGMFDLKGKAKRSAWEKVTKKTPEEAEKEYIELVEGFKTLYKYDANKDPIKV